MKYYIVTRKEMEVLEKAGLAAIVCPKTGQELRKHDND